MELQSKFRQALITTNQSVALVTIVQSKGSVPREAGSKMLVYPNGTIEGTIGGGKLESLVIEKALESLKSGQTCLEDYDLHEMSDKSFGAICGGSLKIFIEPLLQQPTLIIAGAGHVGIALARHAHLLGMYVVVVDDRQEWANSEKLPDVDEILLGPIPEQIEQYTLKADTSLACVTRAPHIDEEIVYRMIDKPLSYLGMIGSQRKVKIVLDKLKGRGVSQESIEKIYAPIGLDINVETPEEIAVCILAELIRVRQGGTGKFRKDLL